MGNIVEFIVHYFYSKIAIAFYRIGNMKGFLFHMNFSKNRKKYLVGIVCGMVLLVPASAHAESLASMVASPQVPEQKQLVLQTTDFGDFASFQEMVHATAAKRTTNAAHINVLNILYKDYLGQEDTDKLNSLLEQTTAASSYDELVKIADDISEEKTYLEQKKQQAIAEAEAKKKAAEEAAAREAQNYSTGYSGSSTGQYSSDSGDARSFIIQKESGGNYTAENGRYYGAYQLDRSYLNGDYSAENQDRTAENYVANRYGSWENAKAFWEQHGWY